jgi:hypothetical protein
MEREREGYLRTRGRKIDSFGIPGRCTLADSRNQDQVRSGRVVLRVRESGASDEIRATNNMLVFSGCLWSSRLVLGNPFPPLA